MTAELEVCSAETEIMGNHLANSDILVPQKFFAEPYFSSINQMPFVTFLKFQTIN